MFWHDRWLGDIPLRLKFPRLFDLAVEKDCSVGNMEGSGWGIDGEAWVWRRRLFAWEKEESVRECSILLHNVILQDTVHDTWRGLSDPIHRYTVQGAYRFITTTEDMVVMSLVDDIWHKHVPLKVSLFVWRFLRNRIPTKDNLAIRGVPLLRTCRVRLSVNVMSLYHIYFFNVLCQLIFGLLFGIG